MSLVYVFEGKVIRYGGGGTSSTLLRSTRRS